MVLAEITKEPLEDSENRQDLSICNSHSHILDALYIGRKKICYFADLATKVLNKVGGWQGRLIKHILQSQTLYPLAAIIPRKTIINQIEMYLANFFWREKDGKKSYHWCSWDNMRYPTDEGGVGFKKLQDICNSFAAKRWWRFRVENNLWTKFLRAKQCQRSNSRVVDEIKQIKIGHNHIQDQAVWTPNPQGSFFLLLCLPAREEKKDNSPHLAKIWNKHLPFKISFTTWRLLKGRLQLDDIVLKFGTNIISRCCCCRLPEEETMNHVFANSNTAKKVWNTMSTPLGFQTTGRNILCILTQWWSKHPKNNVHKFLLLITPTIICWELWKARCGKKYGKKTISIFRICQQVLFQVKVSMGQKFNQMDWNWTWNTVCKVAEDYKTRLKSVMAL